MWQAKRIAKKKGDFPLKQKGTHKITFNDKRKDNWEPITWKELKIFLRSHDQAIYANNDYLKVMDADYENRKANRK